MGVKIKAGKNYQQVADDIMSCLKDIDYDVHVYVHSRK